MDYSQINAYSFASNSTSSTSSSSGTSSSSSKAKRKSSLDMQDFFKLLTAQMQNQTCLDPASDTEFMSQMASFSSLSSMQELNKTATSQYAASLVGKTVTVRSTNKNNSTGTVTGVVESVNYTTNPASITVGDLTYDLTDVIKVSRTPDEV